MMQQLVLGVAGSQTRLNTNIGQTLLVSQNDVNVEPRNEFRSRLRVTDPLGNVTTLEPISSAEDLDKNETSLTWRVPSTEFPGAYLIENEGQQDWREVRVVSVPSAESRLRSASAESLDGYAASISVGRHTSGEQWVASDKADRFGSEIWRLLVFGLLAFLLLEVLWQQRAGYRSGIKPRKTPTRMEASI